MLYRLCYIRNGRTSGVTVWASDLERVSTLAEMWERVSKCQVLTIKPEGLSKFKRRHRGQ